MKKVINGKRYDTDTAEFIGYEQYLYPGQLNYWREELYRKRNGEFFLYGIGGPSSKYGKWEGNSASGNSEIRPLSIKEAQEWVEKYLDADTYEKVFGRVDEGLVQIAIRIPAELKEIADKLGYTQAEIFAEGVKAILSKPIFRILEFTKTFKGKDSISEIEEGCTLYDGDPREIARCRSEEEARRVLSKYRSDIHKMDAPIYGTIYKVTEYIIEKAVFDEDGYDTEDPEVLEIAPWDDYSRELLEERT